MADQPKFSANDLNPEFFGRRGGSQQTAGLNYNVEQLAYPNTVGSDPAYQHYMGFFINIRGKSKWRQTTYKNAVQITKSDENRINPAEAGKGTAVINTVVAGAAGAKLGANMAGSILGNMGATSAKTKKIGVAVGAITGAAAGAIGANYFDSDTTYRIDSAIMLAVSEKPSVKYGVDYTAQDMGTLGGIIAGGTSAVDTSRLGMGGEALRAATLAVSQVPAGVASAMGSDVDMKALSSKGTGTAQNPFREQLFKSVDTREFSFNYKFLPRSAAETSAIQNIIKMFKFHMHPELSGKGLFYIYPSEFNIVYYYAGKANTFIHKISTCVLTSMNIDYGGGGQFSSFADGSPTEYNLHLQFRELETLTKERVLAGF